MLAQRGDKVSNSQGGEEAVILAHVGAGTTGRVLDIGAYDGRTFSNVAALLDRGWSGTLVECSSWIFPKLVARYATRTDIELVNAAVGLAWGLSSYWDSQGDALSTTEAANFDKWNAKANFTQKLTMPMVPVASILMMFPGPYHVVSIDTEGTSGAIFHAIDFNALGTKVVCVEHDGDDRAIAASAATRFGMRELYMDGNNVVLGR